MLGLPELAGLAIVVSLNFYAVTGGADFGGGVLELFASGPRRHEQREAVEGALAPIWEANHVWLIVVIVLMFSAFPVAFAAISTILHIPLVIMLIGIVLRGSAFVFRAYGIQAPRAARGWGHVFTMASAVTPVMLGVTLGATVSGRLRVNPRTGIPIPDFVGPWLSGFPWALGLFVLALFVFLAATYLCVEHRGSLLGEDFRRRALGAGVVAGALAWLTLVTARSGAPYLYQALLRSSWAVPFQLASALLALGSLVAIWQRWFHSARVLVIAQTSIVIWGWAAAQFPYLVVPDLTLATAAAEPSVLRPLLLVLGVGCVVLAPGFVYLFKVFKR